MRTNCAHTGSSFKLYSCVLCWGQALLLQSVQAFYKLISPLTHPTSFWNVFLVIFFFIKKYYSKELLVYSGWVEIELIESTDWRSVGVKQGKKIK